MGGTNRGSNLLDGGAPFYNLYTCKGGGWMSVGCLEPQFFKAFLELFSKSIPADLSVDGWKPTLSSQLNRDDWPRFFEFLQKGFMTNTRDYWTKIFHGTADTFFFYVTVCLRSHRNRGVCGARALTQGSRRAVGITATGSSPSCQKHQNGQGFPSSSSSSISAKSRGAHRRNSRGIQRRGQ